MTLNYMEGDERFSFLWEASNTFQRGGAEKWRKTGGEKQNPETQSQLWSLLKIHVFFLWLGIPRATALRVCFSSPLFSVSPRLRVEDASVLFPTTPPIL
jgi:hypothetical protein